MANNKAFIFKSLKLLENQKKIKEIHWLTESYFCEVQFGITWEDELGTKLPILKVLYPELEKHIEKKSKSEKNVYYTDEITLDGISYLVYNNWLPNVREKFWSWLTTILGCDLPELKEIEEIIKGDEK